MIADLLLRPDNRLLGGATGDFSLFGGQPVPGVTFAREAVANGHVSIAAPAADAMPSGASVIGSGSPGNPNATPTPELSVTGFAALGLANSIPTPPPATADVVPDPLAPANTGFDAPTLDQLVPTGGALIAMVASTADIVSGLAEATTPVTQALADSVIDPLATGVADVLNAVDPVAKPVTDIVEPVVDGLAGTIDPVTSGLAAVAAPAVATIADGAAPLGAALGGTLDAVVPAVASVTPAVDAVIDVVAPVVNAATPVVDVVADTIVPVASAAAPVTAPIADAVQPAGVALQPAADAVATITGDALGGSDPEGGVQTLIGMVANADAFDVIAPGTASAEEPAPSVIDDLIGDVTEVAPLLGDHDGAHDDDGTDLLSGHGGLGLG